MLKSCTIPINSTVCCELITLCIEYRLNLFVAFQLLTVRLELKHSDTEFKRFYRDRYTLLAYS